MIPASLHQLSLYCHDASFLYNKIRKLYVPCKTVRYFTAFATPGFLVTG